MISFSQPIRVGPKKPPRLEKELSSASPPAAAIPRRIAVGKVQNTASARIDAGSGDTED